MHVMLDLETMSTRVDAAVVQIGLHPFMRSENEGNLPPGFCVNVALQSEIMRGAHVDPKTVEWWSKRTVDQRLDVETSCYPGVNAARVVHDYFHELLPVDVIVWSHGASFDIPVLELFFARYGMEKPWNYRNVRDTRTLFEQAENNTSWIKSDRHVAHNALKDAEAQAAEVKQAWQHLAAIRARL